MAAGVLRNERQALTNPTSLVHDLFLQLMKGRRIEWEHRGHFFGIAARILRQLLVGRARRRKAGKRGGDIQITDLSEAMDAAGAVNSDVSGVDLTELDDALNKLEELDPGKALIVELRYFGGLTMEETASAAGISLATAKRHWAYAKRWLYLELSG